MEWRPDARDHLRFQGDGFAGRFQSTVATYPTQFASLLPVTIPTVVENGTYAGGYGLLRWDRAVNENTSLAVQSSYQQERRNELLGHAQAGALDTMLLWNTRRSRHELTGGVNLRLNHDRITPDVATYHPPSWSGLSSSTFLQYDFALQENLFLTFGSKFLQEPYDGFHVQPTARVLWNASSRQSVWAAISRSVRPPTRRERDVEVNLDPPVAFLPVVRLQGSPDFVSEKLLSVEAGYRYSFRRVDLDVATYYGRIADNNTSLLLPFTRDSRGRNVVPLAFANAAQSTNYGIEFASTWQLHSRWQTLLNYTFAERFMDGQSFTLQGHWRAEVPRHQATLISDVSLTPKLAWQQSLYFVDQPSGPAVPAYWRLDTSLSYRFHRQWQFSVGGENLLTARHREAMPDDTTLSRYMRRSAFVRLMWQH